MKLFILKLKVVLNFNFETTSMISVSVDHALQTYHLHDFENKVKI